MSILKTFVETDHYRFIDSVDTWQDAIRQSCQPLEKDGTIDSSYSELIIECVEKYGPYIVIMPNVAMPHSTENAKGVYKTAISFMKVEKPVVFYDEEEGEKTAQLFFTLAACNSDEHMQNMQMLAEMLMTDGLIDALAEVKDAQGILDVDEKYFNEEQEN